PRSVPLPSGPVAVVTGPAAHVPAGLWHAAAGPSAGASAPAIMGSVAEWEAAWGELDRLRAERPVVVLGVEERALRQVLRHAPLTPPMRDAPAWVLLGGRFERLRYASSADTGAA
ncbi:hypothetical protein, partial [Agrococcus sp. HG114]|uniref:hypothetical protein n=1 Tax=Agrococcus sp. HG114 TaxID=2969757 RepID=UPI00215AF238